MLVDRVRPVAELRSERALLHLLETEREDAVGEASLDQLLGHEEGGRAGRAVVVHVVDGDPSQPELVDGALPARRVTVAVADRRLLDLSIRNAGVGERFLARLL